MARNKRSRGQTSWLTRPSTPALGHTVSRYRDLPTAQSLDDIVEAFSNPSASPLIRTVLVDSNYQPAPRRGIRASPVVRSRATGRSSQRRVRSPFLNATTLTPQLTERAILCAKRTIRREVLFAVKRTGRGARSPRRPRSKVRC